MLACPVTLFDGTGKGRKAWNNLMTPVPVGKPIESIDYDCLYDCQQRASPLAAGHVLLYTVTQKWQRIACPAPMQLRDDSSLSYTVTDRRFVHGRAFMLTTPACSKEWARSWSQAAAGMQDTTVSCR